MTDNLIIPDAADAAFADLPPDLRARINEQDWERWLRFYFPKPFTRPFTSYQRAFWEWGWRILPDRYYQPRVECEPRGVGKSTNAELLVVSLLARKRKQAIGYVSGTDDKATKHFNSIKRKLESESLLRDYPHLTPKVQKYRNAFNGWSQDRLITDGGQMIIPITLQGSNRGFKSEDDTRFDLIVLDDIDSLGESPDVVMKNIELLKSEILLAGYANTTIIFPQNLIYRDSICSMVLDHRADMLTDREFVGPFPMMKWYDAEKMDLPGGGKRWVITAGEVFDEAIPIEYCESVLNQIGKDLFDRECQQDVTKVGDDKDFREWNEVYHIITQSEMVAGFPKVQMKDANGFFIPSRWHVGRGFDWGSTRAHPSSMCFVTRPDQTCPNDDCHFFFAEVVLPTFPYDPSIPAEIVSPGRVAAATKNAHRKFRLKDAQVEQSKMSHEASAAQSTLMLDLPDELQMFFKKWKAAKGSGVPQMQNLMEIDHTKPHPFRRFPNGHPRAGEPLMGRPRLYLVVEDGQGELYVDGNGKLRITGAKDAGGFARARYEIPLYNHRNSGQKKIDDDWIDSARGIMATFGVESDKLTQSEQLDALIPEKYKPETLKENYSHAREMSVNFQLAQARKKIEPEVFHFNEALELEVDTWQ
jgi:hypothetical protein